MMDLLYWFSVFDTIKDILSFYARVLIFGFLIMLFLELTSSSLFRLNYIGTKYNDNNLDGIGRAYFTLKTIFTSTAKAKWVYMLPLVLAIFIPQASTSKIMLWLYLSEQDFNEVKNCEIFERALNLIDKQYSEDDVIQIDKSNILAKCKKAQQ